MRYILNNQYLDSTSHALHLKQPISRLLMVEINSTSHALHLKQPISLLTNSTGHALHLQQQITRLLMVLYTCFMNEKVYVFRLKELLSGIKRPS